MQAYQHKYDQSEEVTQMAVAHAVADQNGLYQRRSDDSVIQMIGNPEGAKGRVYRYHEGETEHARDDAGNHWVKRKHYSSKKEYWTEVDHGSQNLHGRGTPKTNKGKGFTHGLMNVLALQGGWNAFRPVGYGGSKVVTNDVGYAYYPKRRYRENMSEVAQDELGVNHNVSASQYARHFGGHRKVKYNWCHLGSFGLTGDDSVENIVVATTHNNTEQMAIEQALYDYKDKGFSVKIKARLARGTDHLAEYIYYEVWYGNFLVYTRTLDARRATEPTFKEISGIKTSVRRALNKAMSRGPVRRYIQGWTTDYLDMGARYIWNMGNT